MSTDRDKLHLLHIRDNLDRIEQYSKGLGFSKFAERERDFDAIMMRVIAIGEEINALSEETKDKYSNLPWHKAIRFRNQIAHGYLDIKSELAWETIKTDLPALKKDIDNLLKHL